ncbi:MAG: AAA family ATPase [Cyanobacteria bacterium HKST-UBA01]|nr:AAA family ATPase [Cyanobacteria bacterium HKST-UBA01]
MNSTGYGGDQCSIEIALRDRQSELRRMGLERLLSAVHGRELTLIQLLLEMGTDSERVESLKLYGLSGLAESCSAFIHERLGRADESGRRYAIIERYYGLDGNLPARLSAMAARYAISRERVRQIKERALATLRLPVFLHSLEEHIKGYVRLHTSGSNRGRSPASGSIKRSFRYSSHPELMMLADIEKYLTVAQKESLRILEAASTASVSGASGTGKTLLALLLARKLAEQGKRVLLTCYNRALANYLESVLLHQPNVNVASFHALCLRIGTSAGISIPGGWNNTVWEHRFPEVLEEALDAAPNLRYDALIVDDAQDIKERWRQALVRIVEPGKGSKIVYLVDDNPLVRDIRFEQPQVEQALTLTQNLRSPFSLGSLIAVGYEGQKPLSIVTAGGELPEYYLCDSADDVKRTIAHLIERLSSECGLAASDIAVLTPRLAKYSRAYGTTTRSWGRLVLRYSYRSGHALLSRVATFKGLEKKAIILVDLDRDFASMKEEDKRALIYQAASRASQRLFLIGDQNGFSELRNLGRQDIVPQNRLHTASPVSLYERLRN